MAQPGQYSRDTVDRPWGESPGGSAAGHRRSVRTEVIWRLVQAALEDQVEVTARPVLDVVDAGGGTGHLAVPIAQLGHHVTVVDPSPDSLAALERRAEEAGVTQRVRALQGDAADLPDILGATADLVLCHSVLEVVDDPGVALRALATVVRPGGALSVVVANRYAVVLAKLLGGHITEARTALTDPAGRWGESDPVPRRFTADQLRRAVEDAGLVVLAEHGVRVVTDLVPSRCADDPSSVAELLDLETLASEDATFRALATQVHVLARRL